MAGPLSINRLASKKPVSHKANKHTHIIDPTSPAPRIAERRSSARIPSKDFDAIRSASEFCNVEVQDLRQIAKYVVVLVGRRSEAVDPEQLQDFGVLEFQKCLLDRVLDLGL